MRGGLAAPLLDDGIEIGTRRRGNFRRDSLRVAGPGKIHHQNIHDRFTLLAQHRPDNTYVPTETRIDQLRAKDRGLRDSGSAGDQRRLVQTSAHGALSQASGESGLK